MGFDLGQLFNPLSLFGAAQQELQQFQNMLNPTKQTDQAGAADSGMNLLNNLGIGDMVTQFTKSHDAQSSSDSDSSSATTETGQQAASAGCAGYAPGASNAPDPDMLKTLEAVVGEFNQFDGQYGGSAFKDGKFDRDNLATIAQNQNDFPPSVYDAAEYLLAHPDVYDQMAELSGGEGCITAKGAQQYQNALTQSPSQQPQQPPAATAGCQPDETQVPSAAKYDRVGGPLHNEPCNSTSSSATATSSPAAASDIRTTIAERGQASLDKLDAQISNLMNGQLDPKSLQQLQQLIEQRQEMFTALSNIDKCFHDMCMTSINNIR